MSLYTKDSSISGTGCFAQRAFRKGDVVGEYTGERITEEEADRRYEEREDTFLFALESGMVIDADNETNPVKYINHGCDPNCEAEETDDGRILIRALRDIGEHEELCYDYNLQADEDDMLICHCGAKKCRGTMKEKK